MIISDLNYLEVVDESTDINGGGGVRFDSRVRKNVNFDKNVDLNVDKNARSFVDVRGNLATTEGSADAFGRNTLTEVDVFTQTTGFSSESFGEALSATR